MRKFLLPILFISSLLPKDIIAVLELEQKGVTKQEAEILTDRLTTKLVSIGKYQLVERTNMDKILKEQKFQKSGCTDSECAVEIGQLLNTDLIVIGSVSKFGSTWFIDSRLIDVAQGNVIISAEFVAEGKIDILSTTGITSIARQLCELEKPSEMTHTIIQKQAEDIDNNRSKKKVKNYPNISDKTWSIEVGLSKRHINLLNISKEFKLGDYFNLSASVGVPTTISFGVLGESSYNNSGIVICWSVGYSHGYWGRPYTSFLSSYAYQWRISKQMLFALGIIGGLSEGVLGAIPVLSLEYKL